jgi:hypothetical protein
MAGMEEIYNAIRAADSAGDAEAVKRLSEYVQQAEIPPQPAGQPITEQPPPDLGPDMPAQTKEPGLGERLGERLTGYQEYAKEKSGGSLTGLAWEAPTITTVAAGQLAGGIGDVIATGLEEVYKAVAPEDVKTLLKDVATDLMETPVGQLGLAALEKGGNLYSAYKEAHPESAMELESAVNVALFGGGAKTTQEILGSKLFKNVFGKKPTGKMLDAAGNPSEELTAALKQSGLTIDDLTEESVERIVKEGGKYDPAQIARQEFLESQDIKPTKAQVTREAADFQAQQEAAKTSGKVRRVLEEQEHTLTTRFDNAILETGGKSGSPTVAVMDSVVEKASKLDDEIAGLYDAARKIAPNTENVKLNNLSGLLKKYKPANRRTGGNISAVLGELKDAGIINKNLKVIKNTTVEGAEDVRKTLNSLYDKNNPYGNMILRELKNGLDDDVFRSSGKDIFKKAREAKARFESDLGRAKISKFDSRKQNLVRDILENKIDPDRFTDRVVLGKTWRGDDLSQLKKYINNKQAWNDLKADVLSTIKDRSFIGPEDASGFKALSRDKLERTLNQIGEKKLGIIFNSDERKLLNDILKVSKLREPVRGTALGKGPSGQAVASLEARLKEVPVLGFLVDVINIDAAGRAALKGKPRKAKKTKR